MVIGRGRRREDPNQHFVLLLLRKKYGKKSTEKKSMEKKVREKNSTGEKYGKKKNGKKVRGGSTGKKVRPDRAPSGHVTLSLPVKKAPLGRILRNVRCACAEHNSEHGLFRSRHFR